MEDSRLKPFILRTFGEEGSFQDNPKDKGNYYKGKLYGTIWGITARDHFGVFWLCLELWNAGLVAESRQRAECFYTESNYWNPLYDLIKDSSLAFKIWDFGINAGVVRSIQILQKTLNKNYAVNLAVDGIFGKYTLQMVNKYSSPQVKLILDPSEIIPGETEFYTLYIKALDKYYRSLQGFFTFGSGWISRLKRIFNGVPDLYS